MTPLSARAANALLIKMQTKQTKQIPSPTPEKKKKSLTGFLY
jgi:hypothetical protein